MYYQAVPQFHPISPPRKDAADPNAHGHSPRGHDDSETNGPRSPISVMGPPTISRESIPPPVLVPHGLHHEDPFWAPKPESFGDNQSIGNCRNITKSSTTSGDVVMKSRSTSGGHDLPMPDYSRATSPMMRLPMTDSSRHPSFASSRSNFECEDYAANRFTKVILPTQFVMMPSDYEDQAHVRDIIDANSPRKHSASGISAPSNTRNSSAANTPPSLILKAAEPGEGKQRVASVTSREAPPPLKRLPSNFHIESGPDSCDLENRLSETSWESNEKSGSNIKEKPASNVKGRKEGNPSDPNALYKPQRRATAPSIASRGKENRHGINEESTNDGKRKRSSKPMETSKNWSGKPENPSTRKASKVDTITENFTDLEDMDDLTEEGVFVRNPLGNLENNS